MNIIFYTTHSEPSKLDKQLTQKASITGELRDECNVVNPVIEFEYNSNILTANYAYIADFNRYYYISDLKINGKRITVNLHVDVLMSFKNDIRNCTAHIIRSASNPNYYLPDNMITREVTINNYSRRIGTGFKADDKYLITVGG